MNFKKILAWLDEHILLIMASFLVVFIPLWPKIPLSIGGQLVELLPGYIVRVRLEDVFILITMIIWLIQVLRKKVSWKTPVTFAIALYAVVGILSTISGVLFTKTIPTELLHVGKSVLHFFRYFEYFSLLFITYASIKSPKHLKIVLTIVVFTILAVIIYGYGQRNWYWPVYSTMNREFSKGVRLYLSEHARVQSTFGGHYDLAAYLVIMTPLLLTGSYIFKNKWLKAGLWTVFLGAFWLMMVTASRISYAAFFLSVGITIVLSALIVRKKWLSRVLWGLKETAIFLVISLIMLTAFGGSLYERLLQTLEPYPPIHTAYMVTVTKSVDLQDILFDFVVPGKQQRALNKFAERFLGKEPPPDNSVEITEAAVMVSSDTQPSSERPSDVYVNVPVPETVATTSADGTVSHIIVEKERTWSANALKYGLSMAIRLDTLWPQAIRGFTRNPLLGSGYATLTKESTIQFTEAESTDNNFLRTLGETGLLGFIAFYGTILLINYIAFKLYKKSSLDSVSKVFVMSFMAATAGILVNAIFIDVFAASKVAFTFWTLAGIVLAIYSMYEGKYFSFDFLQNYLLARGSFKPTGKKIEESSKKISQRKKK